MLYKTIILPVVLYDSETVSYIKERMQPKTGTRGKYLGPKEMRMGNGEGFIMRHFTICTIHLI